MRGLPSLLLLKKKRASAVIVAAGASSRFGGDKIFADLLGEPVILHTLRAFEETPAISEIVLVTRAGDMERAAKMARERGVNKLTQVVAGGKTRVESVLSGLFAASKKADIIAIHDGARPLVTREIIEAAVRKAEKKHAAAPAVHVKATVKLAEGGVVKATPEREKLYEAQTPQAFEASLIKGAVELAVRRGRSPTDDCAAVEAIGVTVYLTEGSYENVKITTPEDLVLAEAILERRNRGGGV
jgi:2-C-methyl-D-erythritol 4-phosphate cytidylyltransferase